MKRTRSSPNVGMRPELSEDGALRVRYRAEMKKLLAKKKVAWAEGNIDASEEISARIRELWDRERQLNSGVGVVIRT